MQERTTRRLTLALSAAAALTVAQSSSAFLMKNMTTGEVLFYDGFEGVNSSPLSTPDNDGDFDPKAAIGQYVNEPVYGNNGNLFEDAQVNIQVTSGSSPGASEGSNYLRLVRTAATPDGTVRGQITNTQGDAHIGEIIHFETMVYIPAGSPNARFQLFIVAHPEFSSSFDTAEVWVRPDGSGNVALLKPGFETQNTGVPYLENTWQKWSIDYAVAGSTFSLSVDSNTATGLPAFIPSGVNGFNVYNGSNDPGAALFDSSVSPKWTSNTPNETWSNDANWSIYTPNSMGATASFTDAITADRTVIVDAPKQVGVIKFDNVHSYTLSGSQTITLNAGVQVLSGNHEIQTPIVLAGDTKLAVNNAASTLKLTGDVTAGVGTVRLTKSGAGTAEMNNIRVSQILANEGTLKVKAGVTANSDAGASLVEAVYATGALDLTNNALIVNYAPENGTPRPALRSLLQSGYNSGAWNGNGIRSSSADVSGNPKMAIAYVETNDLGITTYAGQNFDESAVLLRYALSGDANLDDKVNTLDFNLLAGAFNQTDQQWRNGDFNYDSTVDSIDFTLLTGNYGQSMPVSASLGGVVPEPSCVAVIALGIGAIGRRRRMV